MELLDSEKGLPFESVRSVCEDARGAIWITTQNGLLARGPEGIWPIVFPTSRLAGRPSPTCVAADGAGGVWVGTRKRFVAVAERPMERLGNRGWIGQRQCAFHPGRPAGDAGGHRFPDQLQRLRGRDWHILDFPSAPRSLRAMAQDLAGDVWVGSADGQLFRVHGDQVIAETGRTSAQLLSIRCLEATPDGSLSIGYARSGLGKLKDGHYARITTEQGLNDNYISQMAADGRGRLWCAGNRGLFQARLEELAQAADNKSKAVRCLLHGPRRLGQLAGQF